MTTTLELKTIVSETVNQLKGVEEGGMDIQLGRKGEITLEVSDHLDHDHWYNLKIIEPTRIIDWEEAYYLAVNLVEDPSLGKIIFRRFRDGVHRDPYLIDGHWIDLGKFFGEVEDGSVEFRHISEDCYVKSDILTLAEEGYLGHIIEYRSLEPLKTDRNNIAEVKGFLYEALTEAYQRDSNLVKSILQEEKALSRYLPSDISSLIASYKYG